MKSKVTQFSTDDVKPGKYEAVFLGRKGPVPAPNGPMIFWEFEAIVDEEPLVVSGVSSNSFCHDERCKGMRWARTIDPTLTDESEEWDDDQAIGNAVGIEVVYRESGDQLISSVKDVFAWPQKSPVTS